MKWMIAGGATTQRRLADILIVLLLLSHCLPGVVIVVTSSPTIINRVPLFVRSPYNNNSVADEEEEETMPANRYLACAMQGVDDSNDIFVVGGFDGKTGYDAVDETLIRRGGGGGKWVTQDDSRMRVGLCACTFVGDALDPALFLVAGGVHTLRPDAKAPPIDPLTLRGAWPTAATHMLRVDPETRELMHVYHAQLPVGRVAGALVHVDDHVHHYRNTFYSGGSDGLGVSDRVFFFDQIEWAEWQLPLPAPRAHHHASAVGAKIYIYGGVADDRGTAAPLDTIMYVDLLSDDPTQLRWHAQALEQRAARTSVRHGCANALGAWMPGEQLYIGGVVSVSGSGGDDEQHQLGNACQDRLQLPASAAVVVGAASLVHRHDRSLMLFGGMTLMGESNRVLKFRGGGIDTSSPPPPVIIGAQMQRSEFIMVPEVHRIENGGAFVVQHDREGSVYVLGGTTTTSFGTTLESSQFSMLDRVGMRWVPRAAQTHSQAYACLFAQQATDDPQARYIYSVSSSWNPLFSGQLMRYDRHEDRWQQYSSESAPGGLLASRACVGVGGGRIFVAGGYFVPTADALREHTLANAERPLRTRATSSLASAYDMQHDQWQVLPRLPVAVAEASVAYDARTGSVYVGGGRHQSFLSHESVPQLIFAQRLDGTLLSDGISSVMIGASRDHQWTVAYAPEHRASTLALRETLSVLAHGRLLMQPLECQLLLTSSSEPLRVSGCTTEVSRRRVLFDATEEMHMLVVQTMQTSQITMLEVGALRIQMMLADDDNTTTATSEQETSSPTTLSDEIISPAAATNATAATEEGEEKTKNEEEDASSPPLHPPSKHQHLLQGAEAIVVSHQYVDVSQLAKIRFIVISSFVASAIIMLAIGLSYGFLVTSAKRYLFLAQQATTDASPSPSPFALSPTKGGF